MPELCLQASLSNREPTAPASPKLEGSIGGVRLVARLGIGARALGWLDAKVGRFEYTQAGGNDQGI